MRTAKNKPADRKTNDCIIAAAVLEYRCHILHNDKDFLLIGASFPLKSVVCEA